MVKTIVGVIVGYIGYSAALFILFSGLYLLLGAAGSFQEGNYDLTMSWLLPSIVVFFVAGAIASTICGLISTDAKSSLIMGIVILALGIVMAVSQIAGDPGVTVRETADVGLFDAMGKAHGPIWSHFVNAIAGFLGAVSGGNFLKKGG